MSKAHANSLLWAIVIACAVYLVLWVIGVRFPLPPQPPEAIATAPLVTEPEEEGHDIVREAPSNVADDVVLPRELEIVDDGRDYRAPLL